MFEGELQFTFDEVGHLTDFTSMAGLNDGQRGWLRQHFPLAVDDLTELVHDSKTLTVRLLDADLTFVHFWDEYAYKVGNKSRTEKLWNKLSDTDKLKALEAIAPYKYYLLTRPTMEPLYPETYLNQRRFETDYKALAKPKNGP